MKPITTDGALIVAAISAPRPDYPPADLFKERIQRQPVLGALINEYERAA
jgi:putative transposase